MRPTVFSADVVRRFLRENRISTLPQLKQLLGTEADITVFRKLRELSYCTSYSHRGSFYTLGEIATFDERGLWSFDSVWFSRHGTLVATTEDRVTQSEAGCFASELEDILHVPVKEPLLQLVVQGRIVRQLVSGLYLYCAGDPRTRQKQLRARQSLPDPAAAPAGSGNVSDELRAAIVLFASLLDEQQRRLYAGLESLQLGGDRQIAELLGLDPHTVAKGRRQLLARDVKTDRVRAVGGGRNPVEKNTRGDRYHP
ncbi:MAG TPA: hypothetical protein VFC21_06245 [Bryobacteraceae bacterium]|nr:hypothetical protein [Bryobacteraceae bacterium]